MPAGPGIPGSLIRWRGVVALLILVALPAGPLAAQRVADEVAAPVSKTAERYREAAAARWIRAEALYSSHPDLMPPETSRSAPRGTADRAAREPLVQGTWAPALMIALFVMLLLAWLRFGGTGAVLRRAPKELKQQPVAPVGWQMGAQDRQLSGQGLLDQLAAMRDRRVALIRLLRHVLLAAARDSATQFARADTEREAFARLPAELPHRAALAEILHQVELVHYGGREVSEAGFEQALTLAGRFLLTGQEIQHA